MRRDPDEGHHGTLFAWPDWVLRLIEGRKPKVVMEARALANRFTVELTDAQEAELRILTDVNRVTATIWVAGGSAVLAQPGQTRGQIRYEYQERVDPYGWHSVSDLLGR